LQGQSKVLVLTELGDVFEWVVVVVTKFRGGRGDDASAILVMIDKEGVTHPDEFELPSDDIRQHTSARDLLEANGRIASEEADEVIDVAVLATAPLVIAPVLDHGNNDEKDNKGRDAEWGDEPLAVAPVMAAAESGPRTKRARVGDVVSNWSGAVAAHADYVNKKGKFALGDLKGSIKVDNCEKLCVRLLTLPRSLALPSSPRCTTQLSE